MNVTDEEEQEWIAVEHSHPVYRLEGPHGLDIDRSIVILLNGNRTRCFLGAPWNATRVNFQHGNTWWHITECDQPRNPQGSRPNFYPILEEMISAQR